MVRMFRVLERAQELDIALDSAHIARRAGSLPGHAHGIHIQFAGIKVVVGQGQPMLSRCPQTGRCTGRSCRGAPPGCTGPPWPYRCPRTSVRCPDSTCAGWTKCQLRGLCQPITACTTLCSSGSVMAGGTKKTAPDLGTGTLQVDAQQEGCGRHCVRVCESAERPEERAEL